MIWICRLAVWNALALVASRASIQKNSLPSHSVLRLCIENLFLSCRFWIRLSITCNSSTSYFFNEKESLSEAVSHSIFLSSCLTLVGFGYYNPPPAILQYSILLKNMSSGESFIPVLVNLFILSFCVVFESLSPTTCNSSTLFSSGKKNRPVVMND